MANQDIDRKVQKAFAQLRLVLDNPELSSQIDEESRAILVEHSQKLSSWNPVAEVEAIISNFRHSVSQEISNLEAAASKVTSAAGTVTKDVEKAAWNGVCKGVENGIDDVKDAVTFFKDVAESAELGVKFVAKKATATVANKIIHPIEAELEGFATAVAKKLPFVDLINLILEDAEEYQTRINYMLSSFLKLEAAIAGNKLEDVTHTPLRLKSIESIIVKVVRFIWDHSVPGVLINLLQHPGLETLIHAIVPIPPSINTNFLHVWLSEPSITEEESKLKKPGTTKEEREFRKQLVACIDQFARDHQSANGYLAIPTGTDTKTALNLLSDFFSVVFSCIGGFAFRHPKAPSLTLPKLHWTSPAHAPRRPFDGAHIVSTGVSRSISYSVKGAIGTVGRGIWEINAHNDALVEGIASGIASAIGTLIQSVLHDLFWCLEIREVYEEQRDDAWDSWPAVPEGKGAMVYWGVFERTNVFPDEMRTVFTKNIKKEVGKHTGPSTQVTDLTGILQSYTAYMDAIRSYTDHHDECSDESITIDSDIGSADVTVTYHCPNDDSERCPVIRAYCNGAVMVMKPNSFGTNKTRTYTCTFDSAPPKDATLHVRSNWGAVAQQQQPLPNCLNTKKEM